MSSFAIISEFNPFHNGHKYILDKAKEITNADYSIAIMSGNFVQRGECAIFDKYTRARMATLAGFDVVLELPFPYATGSAKDFALGAIHMINALNCIDFLCFGVENDDYSIYDNISNILINEPDEYKSLFQNALSSGLSFPAAREYALINFLNNEKIKNFISTPNNILALEYICALKSTKSSTKPILIRRIESKYHESNITGSISSATAIRKLYRDYIENLVNDLEFYKSLNLCTPNIVSKALKEDSQMRPIFPNDILPFIQLKLVNENEYAKICDVNNDLSQKLNKINPCISYYELIDTLHTKDITKGHILRCLIHLIFEYTEETRTQFISNNYIFYANLLSFRKNSSSCIKDMKSNSTIPIITKKADFKKYIDEFSTIDKSISNTMWNLDLKATQIYNLLIYNRYNFCNTSDLNTILPIV